MIAEPRLGRETAARTDKPIRTGEDPVKDESEADEFADDSISELD